MRSMIWVATGLLVFGLASAQDALISDPDSDAVNDAEQTQAYRALLHDAARPVTSGREAWLLAKAMSFPAAPTTVHDRAMISALRARAARARVSKERKSA